MKLTFLGTGTSMGIPVIGCDCEVCTSTDPRDKRLRSSALVSVGGKNILIDCGPDFREQMLREGSPNIDAILLTHTHYDHVGGIDDLRPYCLKRTDPMPIYCRPDVAADLRRRLAYCFAEHPYRGVPSIALHEVTDGERFTVEGVKIVALPVRHGHLHILGYRIEELGYITDASFIPEETTRQLKGIDTLVINSLRHKPHPSHFSLKESLEAIRKIGPKRAYLIHLCDQMGKHATVSPLPAGVEVAYDGLTVVIPSEP